MSEVSRPLLRYHGGKFLLAPWIISHFPEHRIYVEPFGGAASVLLSKPRSETEVYNDMDGDIVNLFRVLRSDQSSKLQDLLEMTPYARDEFYTAYEPAADAVETARRTLVRAWMCSGTVGACRTSRSGFDISPVSLHRFQGVAEGIKNCADRFKNVTVENRPAVEVLQNHDSDQTLFYCDPPYVASSRSSFGGGVYRHEMTDEQHREFASRAKAMAGMVIISGYHSELYDELFGDWRVVEKAALADGARERIEVLWLSPNVKPSNEPYLL